MKKSTVNIEIKSDLYSNFDDFGSFVKWKITRFFDFFCDNIFFCWFSSVMADFLNYQPIFSIYLLIPYFSFDNASSSKSGLSVRVGEKMDIYCPLAQHAEVNDLLFMKVSKLLKLITLEKKFWKNIYNEINRTENQWLTGQLLKRRHMGSVVFCYDELDSFGDEIILRWSVITLVKESGEFSPETRLDHPSD